MTIAKFRIAVLLCTISLGAAAQTVENLGAPPEDTTVARDRLVAYLDATKGMRGAFRQIDLNEDDAAVAESIGKVAVQSPGRFRWEYVSPEPQLLVTDGQSLWNFDPDLESVYIRTVASLEGANPAQLLNGEADLERDYEVIGSYKIEDVEWFEVRPRAAASDFEQVRLGFVEGTVSMLELWAKTGSKTQIILSDVEVNPTLSADLFTFVPPDGVDVDDNR
ncbi:MAG: outer membrane lipoprotein chaperone LolA [Gammaproteobacteria bacterium]